MSLVPSKARSMSLPPATSWEGPQGTRMLLGAAQQWARGHRHRLPHQQLDIWINVSKTRVIRPWGILQSLETLQPQLDKALSNPIYAAPSLSEGSPKGLQRSLRPQLHSDATTLTHGVSGTGSSDVICSSWDVKEITFLSILDGELCPKQEPEYYQNFAAMPVYAKKTILTWNSLD